MDINQVIDRFSGEDYLGFYDRYRPSAPRSLVDATMKLAGVETANLIIDIGSGTGLSAYIWKDQAKSIIGIEPSSDMRRIAEALRTADAGHIRFVYGLGRDIPLADDSADIVSCGQVFHWMDIPKTLAEVNRVLRPGGVFVVYDCSWPPSFHLKLELAYKNFFIGIDKIAKGYNSEIVIGHMKEKHYDNIRASGYFKFLHEFEYNEVQPGSAERFEGILMSQGGVHALLRKGLTPDEIGLTRFRKTIRSVLNLPNEMTFQFKSIFAVKRV